MSAAGGGVTWSPELAGPARADLEHALDLPFEDAWDTHLPKTGERRRVTSCREALALPRGFTPDDQSDPQWYAFVTTRVRCRVVEQLGKATPARTDHLGKFTLDNARLAELPAILHPLAGPGRCGGAVAESVRRRRVVEEVGQAASAWCRATENVSASSARTSTASSRSWGVATWTAMASKIWCCCVRVVVAAEPGSSITAFVVTRRGPDQRVEVLRELN